MKMGGAVGIMMFLQHWYWYPLMPFLSLAFSPTMLIGLNKDFNMPTQFQVTCNAPPAMFAYHKVEEKKEVRRASCLLLYYGLRVCGVLSSVCFVPASSVVRACEVHTSNHAASAELTRYLPLEFLLATGRDEDGGHCRAVHHGAH
jgi:hypothetical protein